MKRRGNSRGNLRQNITVEYLRYKKSVFFKAKTDCEHISTAHIVNTQNYKSTYAGFAGLASEFWYVWWRVQSPFLRYGDEHASPCCQYKFCRLYRLCNVQFVCLSVSFQNVRKLMCPKSSHDAGRKFLKASVNFPVRGRFSSAIVYHRYV